jgi:uncharacterized RDD family membrane protein YckC
VTEPVAAEDENGPGWRDELTARLSKYRARRTPRPPRYPSLRLRFEADLRESQRSETGVSGPIAPDPEAAGIATPGVGAPFAPRSDQALALDGISEVSARVENEGAEPSAELSAEGANLRLPAGTKSNPGARIIEFPRSAEFQRSDELRSRELQRFEVAPLPAHDELAGPVMTAPRILEAPEVVPSAPALGGITMEAVEPKDAHRQPGIDIPLQAASLPRRLAAAMVDGLIVLIAAGLFGLIFWKVTGIRPPQYQLLGLAVAIPCVLWAAYQYLLLVYAATTPGLRIAGLALARFDGTFANRRLRRWRVLASYLAAVSLGMGYLWLFLDEDAMCWHDRITHTYLAPKKTE